MTFDRSIIDPTTIIGQLALDYLVTKDIEYLRKRTFTAEPFSGCPFAESTGLVIEVERERLRLLSEGWLQLVDNRTVSGDTVFFKIINSKPVILYIYPIETIYKDDRLQACQVTFCEERPKNFTHLDVFNKFKADPKTIAYHASKQSWPYRAECKKLFRSTDSSFKFDVLVKEIDDEFMGIWRKHFPHVPIFKSQLFFNHEQKGVKYNLSPYPDYEGNVIQMHLEAFCGVRDTDERDRLLAELSKDVAPWIARHKRYKEEQNIKLEKKKNSGLFNWIKRKLKRA